MADYPCGTCGLEMVTDQRGGDPEEAGYWDGVQPDPYCPQFDA